MKKLAKKNGVNENKVVWDWKVGFNVFLQKKILVYARKYALFRWVGGLY